MSQPLSQCKHVLIEIRSSGYNSFADVAARPPFQSYPPLFRPRIHPQTPTFFLNSLLLAPALYNLGYLDSRIVEYAYCSIFMSSLPFLFLILLILVLALVLVLVPVFFCFSLRFLLFLNDLHSSEMTRHLLEDL